jgi:hypothetical protein
MSAHRQLQIVALWTVFLLGTLFHTQLGLMPLFHGSDVTQAHLHDSSETISTVLWLMLAFFTLPMLAIAATAFFDSQRYRATHFVVTVFYSILNFLHLFLDLQIQPIAWYQIALMAFLFVLGLVLNIVGYLWLKELKGYSERSLKPIKTD